MTELTKFAGKIKEKHKKCSIEMHPEYCYNNAICILGILYELK